jgi:[acyl-carrier-protein] S-malonyltransferase
MSKVAWLFPGQGSQAVGMGTCLLETEIDAQKVIQEADKVLGFSLSALMINGPEEQLKLTEYTQPAVLTHSTMVVRAFGDKLPKPDFVAGHSLGEYSALVASGALSFDDAVCMVRERGRAMQVALPIGIGTMAAIMGATVTMVKDACDKAQIKTGLVVVPANFNGPGQIVIAGHNEAVDSAIDILKAGGCRMAVKLPVSAPFHSPLMEPARIHLQPLLEKLPISIPSSPLVNNVDAIATSDPNRLRSGLIRQIAGAVYWEDTISLLLQEGVTTFFELGHGNILTNLLKRQAKNLGMLIKAHAISSAADVIAAIN